MNKITKLLLLVLITGFIFSSKAVFAEVPPPVYSSNYFDTSEQIFSSFNKIYQTLGNNLSGILTRIDVVTSNSSALYYGSTPQLRLYECDDNTYGGILSTSDSQCSNLYTGSADSGSLLASSTQSFYLDSVTLNQSKYYYFAAYGNNIFNALPKYYGSSIDTVDGACYQHIITLGKLNPCLTVSDLYFKFHGVSKVTTEIATGTSVVFFPGIMGSRLYEGGVERWVSAIDSNQAMLALDSFGKSIENVYTKDDTQKTGTGDETGIVDDIFGSNIYQSFIGDLSDWKDDGIITDYSFIPYDWRLSLDDIITKGATSTSGILTYNRDQEFSESYILKKLTELGNKSEKIVLIGHSNGGLVIKALVQKLKDTNNPLYYKIDKIIFVAVPQVGTPEAIVNLLHGSDLGWLGSVMTNERARFLSNNMPGVYNLLPSSSYFSSVTDKVVTFQSNPLYNNQLVQYGTQIDNSAELKNYITGTDSRVIPFYDDTDSAEIGNLNLYNKANIAHLTLDSWMPATTTKVIQIAGWGEETLAGLDYKVCKGFLTDFYKCFKPRKVVDGDGTVVTPSALWMSTSIPNVERWWVDLGKYDKLTSIERIHRDILEVKNLREYVEKILSGNPFHDSENIIVNNTSSLIPDGKRLHFILHSPLTLGFKDNQGKYTGIDPFTKQFKDGIPNVKYEVFGKTQFISIPDDIDGKIVLDGYEEGVFTLDIEKQVGNEITEETSFQAIPTSTTTIVIIDVNRNSSVASSTLKIDQNGDGIIDTELQAKIGEVVTYPKYLWEGYLQPINDTKYHPEQKQSVFKTGSTIPVKFQLKDLDGKVTQSNSLPIWITPQKLNSMNESIGESTYSDSGTSGSTYRLDSNSQQYIYNWSTKGLQSGYWYKVTTKLDDGNVYSVVVGLR